MAKSARASVRKRNNAIIRAKVFGPAVDARTERLSAKLQELAAKPRPDEERVMEVDESEDITKSAPEAGSENVQDADVEMTGHSGSRKTSKKGHSTRIEKKSLAKRKPRNKVVFPTSAGKRKRIASSKKKSV